ncbi:hypothetical protein [Lysobacter sp. 22409]|uniref:hypothetical protein n=1 Tax=Lysobacter sp. 22409 TaxID=3453917 RepID=UPI003F87C217
MRWIVVFAAAGLLAGCATNRPAGLSSQSLAGTWRCGPIAIPDPNYDLVVSTETINRADGRYTSLTTSVITPHGKSPVVIQDRASGTWLLEGDILVSKIEEVKFLSSSDSWISNERGQKVQDDMLKKKSVYRSRILKFTGRTLRIVPVEPTYKEAEVESLCKRV